MTHIIKRTFLVLVFAVSFALSLNAQDSKSNDKNAEFDGYCPVAYLVMNKNVVGDPKYSSTYGDKTYYLANADAKKMFDADPLKYLPKYDGFCATAVSMGKKIESDPELFSVYKGATYLFSNQMAKDKFDENPDMIIKKAEENFAALIK